jgi:hypothetical protein
MQAHYHAVFETPLPPDRVLAALTDFSADRTKIWRGLDPDKYEVYEVGSAWTVAKEGNRTPDVWSRERYDWSSPGKVSWVSEDSNAFTAGSRVDVGISDGPGGGSRVEITGFRKSASPVGFLTCLLLAVLGKRYALTNYKATFDRLAEEEGRDPAR